MNLSLVAIYLGQPVNHLPQARPQLVNIRMTLGQKRTGYSTILIQQCQHQMHRLYKLVAAANRQALGFPQRLLKLRSELVHSHGTPTSS